MNLSQKSEAEILSVANPMMDNLMDASTHVDYERHISVSAFELSVRYVLRPLQGLKLTTNGAVQSRLLVGFGPEQWPGFHWDDLQGFDWNRWSVSVEYALCQVVAQQ